MNNIEILKRLYKDYTKKYLNKIFLAVFFSILVAGSTSATAWLLDPAIEKIFINKQWSSWWSCYYGRYVGNTKCKNGPTV